MKMKNDKITVYDLLGLIKEGKAPKKIMFNDKVWEYDNSCDYIDCNGSMFFEDYCYTYRLNEEVEILEEHIPIIEPITLDDWCEITYEQNWNLLKNDFNKNMQTIFDRFEKIIDYINRKEDK